MQNNGFGFGFGKTYPTRFGTPESQQVMSDTEFGQSWQSKLDAVPKSIAQQGDPIWELVLDKWVGGNPDNNWAGPGGAPAAVALRKKLEEAPDTKVENIGWSEFNNAPIQRIYAQTGFETSMSRNPEWDALNNQYQGALKHRQESQIANQQAYNNMLGNSQLDGIMTDAYKNPNFGQVTGTNDSGMPSGADMSWTTGVYNGQDGAVGTYNPQAVKKNFWGL